VLAALLALVLGAGSALAGPDDLKGGSVSLQLQNSRGLKLKPRALTLPITGGAVDPVNGSGTAKVSGGFQAKRGKGKAKVKLTAITLGANGGPGSISAKVGKRNVSNFATLAGGSVARSGFGATISNIRATIAAAGARALNRTFSPKKGKGAKKSAGGGVKAGQPLGTIVSLTTDPRSVEVLPGGTLTLHTSLSGAFASKLPKHCIEPLSGGVAPVAPATQFVADFNFPVTGGSAAPDFSAGEVITGGGQTLSKNSTLPGILTPASCPGAEPPNGTQLVSTDIGVDFAQNLLNSTAALPTGTSLRAPLADIDFSTGTRSFDPSTNELDVTGATVSLSYPAALTLNTFFPNQSGSAGDDFAPGDAIGTIDLTGVTLR
jgi:hypothetical protein